MDNNNNKAINRSSRYIVMTASTKTLGRFGTYRRVAVLELEPDFSGVPKMISDHARGVVRVVRTWEKCNVGKSDRCAYSRAIEDAKTICAALNSDAMAEDQ